MARMAGIDSVQQYDSDTSPIVLIERFASLIASAEREEIIKIAKDLYYWDDSELLIKAIQARGSDAEKN